MRTPDRYMAAIDAGALPEAGHELLDPAARSGERIALALRTRDGIKLAPTAVDLSPVDACLDDLVDAGLLGPHGGRLVLTRRGRLLASEVAARVLAALDDEPERQVVGTGTPAGTR